MTESKFTGVRLKADQRQRLEEMADSMVKTFRAANVSSLLKSFVPPSPFCDLVTMANSLVGQNLFFGNPMKVGAFMNSAIRNELLRIMETDSELPVSLDHLRMARRGGLRRTCELFLLYQLVKSGKEPLVGTDADGRALVTGARERETGDTYDVQFDIDFSRKDQQAEEAAKALRASMIVRDRSAVLGSFIAGSTEDEVAEAMKRFDEAEDKAAWVEACDGDVEGAFQAWYNSERGRSSGNIVEDYGDSNG